MRRSKSVPISLRKCPCIVIRHPSLLKQLMALGEA